MSVRSCGKVEQLQFILSYLMRISGPLGSIMAMEIPKDSVFYDITVACMKMVLTALVVLLIAASVEAFYPPWMLEQLSQWLGR